MKSRRSAPAEKALRAQLVRRVSALRPPRNIRSWHAVVVPFSTRRAFGVPSLTSAPGPSPLSATKIAPADTLSEFLTGPLPEALTSLEQHSFEDGFLFVFQAANLRRYVVARHR